jgi:hypothetical protein
VIILPQLSSCIPPSLSKRRLKILNSMFLRLALLAGKGARTRLAKRGSIGISNVPNAAVGDRFFDKHEYHDCTPEQNNTLCLKRLKRRHVGNGHGGNNNGTGKGDGKGPTLKSLTCSITELATKFDKCILPDVDYDESAEEDEGTSNRSNAAMTRQHKNQRHGGNWKANLSAFTMRLGSVGHVEKGYSSDLDSHAECCVYGKEILVFNDFDQ